MNQTRYQMLESWLESHAAACKAEVGTLNSDQRGDEAVFAKIRMNVFDIFRTVLTAGKNAVGDDEEKLRIFFQDRLNQIPENWRASLLDAERHGNFEKAHIERLKLRTAEEITDAFRKIWEAES